MPDFISTPFIGPFYIYPSSLHISIILSFFSLKLKRKLEKGEREQIIQARSGEN